MSHPLRLISAMSQDGVIGVGDGMPWDVPEEYAHFLDSVRGGAVILGRKSFEIFGPDLGEARAIVLTRRASLPGGVQVASDLEQALRTAERWQRPPWIAGGASVYAQALPRVDEMHLSLIPGRFEGDAYFPDWSAREWLLVEEVPRPNYLFRRYVRRT